LALEAYSVKTSERYHVAAKRKSVGAPGLGHDQRLFRRVVVESDLATGAVDDRLGGARTS